MDPFLRLRSDWRIDRRYTPILTRCRTQSAQCKPAPRQQKGRIFDPSSIANPCGVRCSLLFAKTTNVAGSGGYPRNMLEPVQIVICRVWKLRKNGSQSWKPNQHRHRTDSKTHSSKGSEKFATLSLPYHVLGKKEPGPRSPYVFAIVHPRRTSHAGIIFLPAGYGRGHRRRLVAHLLNKPQAEERTVTPCEKGSIFLTVFFVLDFCLDSFSNEWLLIDSYIWMICILMVAQSMLSFRISCRKLCIFLAFLESVSIIYS